ncbi:hypothetical protein [Halomarina ordinaria]|uniref:Uncharacterized protein n=1 Tax=Halomarina ordinaria TaxID=3033939 RepID=A0ABD5UBP8_9EURY|nr:hypothetical protein [Halomarina sp. PSRA2]
MSDHETAPTRYDALLAAMPVALAVGGVAGAVLSVPFVVGLAGGSLPASGLLGYALFVDPPEGA